MPLRTMTFPFGVLMMVHPNFIGPHSLESLEIGGFFFFGTRVITMIHLKSLGLCITFKLKIYYPDNGLFHGLTAVHI
jgi:hypothetical protein